MIPSALAWPWRYCFANFVSIIVGSSRFQAAILDGAMATSGNAWAGGRGCPPRLRGEACLPGSLFVLELELVVVLLVFLGIGLIGFALAAFFFGQA